MKLYLTLFILSIALLPLTAQNIPIDFEEDGNGADWTWTTFENDTNPGLEIISNPDPSGFNTSSTVAKFTALQTGQPFAGCETLHGAGIGTFTIDASNSTIRIMVWKSVISDVGIKLVRADDWSLGEITIPNTVVNQWEQLEFDFSAHVGNTYDQIVVFPDFNARDSDNIIYFDNVYGEVGMTTSTKDLNNIELNIFPNPAKDVLNITSDRNITDYKIYSITGELVSHSVDQENNSSINISELPKGTYLLRAVSKGQSTVQTFIKE